MSSSLNLNSAPTRRWPIISAMQRVAHPRSIEAIAARLEATRKALKLNKARFCAIAGIEPNTYSNWVIGLQNRPDIDKALMLCDGHALTLDWIYRGSLVGLDHDLRIALVEIGYEPPEPSPAPPVTRLPAPSRRKMPPVRKRGARR